MMIEQQQMIRLIDQYNLPIDHPTNQIETDESIFSLFQAILERTISHEQRMLDEVRVEISPHSIDVECFPVDLTKIKL